ncbi:MAG: hypothetical protein R2911_19475 [Caldilineaceae bacterium]
MTIEGRLEEGKPEESFPIPANGQQNLVWPVAVDAASGQVTVTGISAESDTYADAVCLTIPVRRYETPEVVATSGAVPASGVTEAVHPSPRRRTMANWR